MKHFFESECGICIRVTVCTSANPTQTPAYCITLSVVDVPVSSAAVVDPVFPASAVADVPVFPASVAGPVCIPADKVHTLEYKSLLQSADYRYLQADLP